MSSQKSALNEEQQDMLRRAVSFVKEGMPIKEAFEKAGIDESLGELVQQAKAGNRQSMEVVRYFESKGILRRKGGKGRSVGSTEAISTKTDKTLMFVAGLGAASAVWWVFSRPLKEQSDSE